MNGSAESTGQLSVAELIARREAETVEIPVITDDITPEAFEPTVKLKPVKVHGGKLKKQPMGELHITELLRREGRADDTQRGGFTVGKLAVAASGGVVLCGSMAFAASSLLSSPDERPLAEVRFDERAQARAASAGTEGGVVKLPSNKTQQADATETQETTEETTAPTTRVAPYVQTQQPRPAQQPTQTQQPTQQPTSETPPAASTPTSSPETTQPSTPPSSQTPAPPAPTTTTSASTPATAPSSVTPPPSSSSNPLPTSANPVDVSVDLGLLDPVLDTVGDVVGGFDFFAPVN
ncbi:hypothetical protein [Lentzea fradiae]|uniref:hypothetical protein n=1 Tax=Lentzea fradiae TaxID=200378 RepID=UPI000B7FECD8|nr:hypothetical protein [Lentzea fradiae]